jgi:hypothetical protein
MAPDGNARKEHRIRAHGSLDRLVEILFAFTPQGHRPLVECLACDRSALEGSKWAGIDGHSEVA